MLKGRISLEPQVGFRGSAAGGESGCFQVEVQGPLACASHCRGQLAGLGPSGLVRSLHVVRTRSSLCQESNVMRLVACVTL